MNKETPFYKVPEFAKLLGLSESTIRRLLKSGEIKGFQVTKGGDWRIEKSELNKFIK